MMKLLRILLLVALGVCVATEAVTCAAAAEPAPKSGDTLYWRWSGDGYFAQAFGLTLLHPPGAKSFVLLEEWGKLESGDGWKELQRSYQMTYGSIRQIGDRNFIVFAELQRAAEFTIAADGVLQLQWFPIATPKPADTELLSRRGRIPGLPDEMKPGWEPSPGAKTVAPL
jgi:hypothetical protein